MFVFVLAAAHQSTLWFKLPFWEDVFHDAIALERELVGLDQEVKEMMDRYDCFASVIQDVGL